MWQESGFIKDNSDIAIAIAGHLLSVPEKFRKFTPGQLLEPSAPGKWCRQEILGHLIDSAINNLKRFTDIQFLAQPYIVQSYKQDELVVVNNYAKLPLEHLLDLWQILNRQIIFVVENIPDEKLLIPVDPGYADGEMRSLGWVIADYVAHMEHHFLQIFGTE
jgi:hypothetical protein